MCPQENGAPKTFSGVYVEIDGQPIDLLVFCLLDERHLLQSLDF